MDEIIWRRFGRRVCGGCARTRPRKAVAGFRGLLPAHALGRLTLAGILVRLTPAVSCLGRQECLAHFGRAGCLKHTLGRQHACPTGLSAQSCSVPPSPLGATSRCAQRGAKGRIGSRYGSRSGERVLGAGRLDWVERFARFTRTCRVCRAALRRARLDAASSRACATWAAPVATRVSPMTTGLTCFRGRTEQLDERSPLRFCTLVPSRSPAPLLRNRFQSLVRFPSRHAAVRSADEPVSPGFGPSCEG
jgi:hypothetical protein